MRQTKKNLSDLDFETKRLYDAETRNPDRQTCRKLHERNVTKKMRFLANNHLFCKIFDKYKIPFSLHCV